MSVVPREASEGVPLLIDHQTHWFPRAYFEARADRPPGVYPRAERDGKDGFRYWVQPGDPWLIGTPYHDLDVQLADMDANGIDVALMSPSLIGEVMDLELAEAVETLAFVNEESARAVRAEPDRRRGLALLPMQDAAAAIDTLDDAIERLGLSGVSMMTNVAGKPLVSEATVPVFERIAELEIPVVLHPSIRSFVFDRISHLGRVVEAGLAWMFETSTAALSFIYSGVLDRFPKLTIVHPHLGGVLPYLQARFEITHEMHGGASRPLRDYLREHFYTDIVNVTPGAVQLAVDTYGEDRILFASDYPWVAREVAIDQLRNQVDPDLSAQIRRNGLPMR